MRKQSKNNKLKIIAPTWNDEFELPDGSYFVSDLQDDIEYIKTKRETLKTGPPIHVYINRINNMLVLKIKDEHKLELKTPETNKLFGNIKKVIDKRKYGENVPSLKVVEVVLVQCNWVSDVLYIFTHNKSYAYLLNVKSSNLVFWKSYYTDFDEIIRTFTYQNGRPLEIGDKVNLMFLVNK